MTEIDQLKRAIDIQHVAMQSVLAIVDSDPGATPQCKALALEIVSGAHENIASLRYEHKTDLPA